MSLKTKKTEAEKTEATKWKIAALISLVMMASCLLWFASITPEDEIKYAIQIRLVPLDDESLPSVIEMRDENGSLLERMTVVRGPEEAFAHSTSELGYTLVSLEGCTVDTGDHLITMHVTDFELTVGTLEFGDAMSASYEYDDYIVSVILWEDE